MLRERGVDSPGWRTARGGHAYFWQGVRVDVDPGPGNYATALRVAETKPHT